MDLLILCIKIFFVRIIDVSLGTARTIITIRGKALIASAIGFFEVLVWFLIVREALSSDVGGIWVAISYSLGFAAGTFIGSVGSEKIIKTNISIQVITNSEKLDEKLRRENYGVTVINVEGHDASKKKYMLLIETTNKNLSKIKEIIKQIDTNAFIVVNEIKLVQNGYFK